MFRRNKKIQSQRSYRNTGHWTLPSETKRGIITIIVFAVAFFSLLSFFQAAGAAGIWINLWQGKLFGWADWLIPLLLLILGYLLLRPSVYDLKIINYIGLVLLIAGYSGLLHLSVRNESLAQITEQGRGGGYIGYIVGHYLLQAAGLAGSLVVLLTILLVGLLIFFNSSLQAGANLWQYLKLWFARWRQPRDLGADDADAESLETEARAYEMSTEEALEPEVSDEQSAIQSTDTEDANGQKKLIPDHVQGVKKSRSVRKITIPFDLLTLSHEVPASGDIKLNAKKIETTLKNFGIDVTMGDATVGPTVTQYTLKPSEGVKLNQITALQNDLALALAAHPIRIEAPIPGKSLVGIEVPNQAVSVVKLREVLESGVYQGRKSNLMLALGKDVTGRVMMANLEKMPHLLIAGATGSGKSVCINSLIVSMLYQNSPDLLKFILVDPKRVELSIYNGIPHLLTPVITDIDKTINALRWAVNQMDERYKLLAAANKRNIESYNSARLLDKLPYIVVVIDELADLMSVAPKEVESAIVRLAQMARAVGIHLILATQRPSVNVITGLIKANITSRIAFAVASSTDSRTIIDSSGAEKLLGNGDMLYISAELSKPKRIQGALITDQEINAVVQYLSERGEPQYDEAVTERQASKIAGNSSSGFEIDAEEQDLQLATEVVVRAKRASATLLQSRMRIGFAKASRLLDLLEERGIIGPQNSSKPREVLITGDELEQSQSYSEPYQEETGEDETAVDDNDTSV